MPRAMSCSLLFVGSRSKKRDLDKETEYEEKEIDDSVMITLKKITTDKIMHPDLPRPQNPISTSGS